MKMIGFQFNNYIFESPYILYEEDHGLEISLVVKLNFINFIIEIFLNEMYMDTYKKLYNI